MLRDKNRKHLDIVAQNTNFPSFKELLSIMFTFGLTVFAWIFFRAESLSHAINYIESMMSVDFFSIPTVRPSKVLLLIIVFMFLEWVGRKQEYAIEVLFLKQSKVLRWSFYMVIIALIFVFNTAVQQEFIYFQF